MTDAITAAKAAKDSVERAGRAVSPWAERIGRVGQATHGLVYVVGGVFAFEAALGVGAQAPGLGETFASIARTPMGRPLLALLTLGLISYALWQVFRAVANPDYEPDDRKGFVHRLGWGLTATGYATIALGAVQALAPGAEAGSEDAAARSWSATALSEPFGPWLLGLVGGGVAVGGAWIIWKGWTADLDTRIDVSHLSVPARGIVTLLGRVGVAARGVAWLVVAGFLIVAAAHFDPDEARGLVGALRSLPAQPYGAWLLGVIGVGFVAYGVYEVIAARYRPSSPAAVMASRDAGAR